LAGATSGWGSKMTWTRKWIWIAALLRVVTFGIVALDRPKGARIRRMNIIHRWVLGAEARYRGRRDGRLGIPRPDEEQPPPEIWKLKQQAESVLRRIGAHWAEGDARLQGETDALVRESEQLAKSLAETRDQMQHEHDRFEQRRSKLDREKELDEKRHADDRWRIATPLYWAGILLIFLGEFPLNAVAFNLFGEDRIFTYIMTAGLAASLVLCAHGLGVIWRLRNPHPRDEMIGRGLLIFPLLVIVGIGIVREVYVEEFAGGASVAGSLGPIGGVVIFVVMNALIFVAAFVLSYLHHDPEGNLLDRLEKDVKRSDRRLRKQRRVLQLHLWVYRWVEGRIALWRAAREGALRNARFEAHRHKDIYEALMQSYWSSNRAAAERRQRRVEREWKRARRWHGKEAGPEPRGWTAPVAMQREPTIMVPREFEEGGAADLLRAVNGAQPAAIPDAVEELLSTAASATAS
jgi:hypothetical protein